MSRHKENSGGGGHLRKINRLAARIPIPENGVTVVNSKADFGIAVGGVITLKTNEHYVLNAQIDLGSDVLEGVNISIEGRLTFATLLFTDSTSPLISSSGVGFIQLRTLLAANLSGPFLNATLGNVPNFSVLVLDTVRFNGDLLLNGTGLGTLGTVNTAQLVIISNCSFLEMIDGLKLTGQVDDISVTNTLITSRTGASAFIGVEVLAAAVLDIAVLNTVRFSTANAADRCVNFSSSATYGSPIRVTSSTIRGLGKFVAAAGLQKSDPDFISSANEGNTAPIDSQFAANASFQGNTVETVIAAIGVQVPIGSGNPSHALFNSGAFAERFTLDGAETQLQKFTHIARDTGTYNIDLHTQLTRAGGGIVLFEQAIQVEGVTIPDSVTITEVGNSATSGYASTTVQLDEGDEISLVIANNTSLANLIVNSAAWRINKL